MKRATHSPPSFFLRFFRWYCHPRLHDYIEGDLMEAYRKRLETSSKRRADIIFVLDVLSLFRPGIIRPVKGGNSINTSDMYKSYFKIGWRKLLKEQGYSFINVGGLAVGIAVAILIGLWIYDELSFDKAHEHYAEVALVLQHNTVDGHIETWANQSYQLGPELRSNHGDKFRHVVMSYSSRAILSHDDKTFGVDGNFMESGAPDLLALEMVHGTRSALREANSILIAESVAKRFFGNEDPIGRVFKVDNDVDLRVTGVYRDIPENSSFGEGLHFIAPLKVIIDRGGRNFGWINNWLLVFVQVEENANMSSVSDAIRDAKLRNVSDYGKRFKPELFLHPMSKWHLYSEFQNRINTGGRIQFVWLFGAVGVFVLLLACINFMNLSTARSQKRAREVGVRKAVGSLRGQLIGQFLSESLLVVTLAFSCALILVYFLLPSFNEIAQKDLAMPWTNPWVWMLMVACVFLLAMISGSYPAFYLSAFRPIKVLKGTFRVAYAASRPRRVLVVVQFTVSVVLAIGAVVVFQQVQHAKNRPIGYELNGLIHLPIETREVKANYQAFRNELLASGAFSNVSASETTVTNMWWSDNGFSWKGRDPDQQDILYRGAVDYDFGRTVGWNIKAGRDFSRDFPSDSSAMILNEAAVAYMGFDDPVGEQIQAYGITYTVIGVVEDMVSQSLYEPNKQTFFILDRFSRANYISVRIAPESAAGDALAELKRAFIAHNPNTPFEYEFADEEFARKFAFEARVGKLVSIFASLAIFISCLGLFGLASYVAEQRTKELGVRKVLGASVIQLWKLLAAEFVWLVTVAVGISIPIAWYLMRGWLEGYRYRVDLQWWIFAGVATGALLITLLTVSYQSISAARTNPVKSLSTE